MAKRAVTSESKVVRAGQRHSPAKIGADSAAGTDAV